jgi:hypothetical protein
LSINSSQASLLASGFLDNIGEEIKGLQPRETLTELFLIVGELIEKAQTNLNKSNSNASGSLSSSIQARDPVRTGSIVKTDIEMNYYGEFINSGVRGTKTGRGKYAFKTAFPSKKMVASLLQGMKSAKLKTFNTSSRTISANEQKNRKISDISKAYGAGRNIKMYGIEPTNFFDRAVAITTQDMQDRLGAALKIDIINSIT